MARALEARMRQVEEVVGAGRPEPYVSTCVTVRKGLRMTQDECDLAYEAEDRRCAEARAAGREVAVVVRIGHGIAGWRERRAAQRGEG